MRAAPRNAHETVDITPALLRAWPLPMPGAHGDKDTRGRVLIVGGASQMPGAVMLAAEAALRAGAGKLQIATCASIAPWVATAVPEARVIALPERASGAFDAAALPVLEELGAGADAIVVGPGQLEDARTHAMLARWLGGLPAVPVVVDAAALCALPLLDAPLDARLILTPHAGEMARLLVLDKHDATADALHCALQAVDRFDAVVAAKGASTYVAGGTDIRDAPRGPFRNRAGNIGLATSGSGDTLAGVVGGLAARGASPLQATVWGVHLHAKAGDVLAERIGPLGFLARELLAEIPALMHALQPTDPERPARE